jgi:two-component system phosphate regulon sensor histidine kinase PhoR
MLWDYWRLLALLSVAGFVGLIFGQMMTFMFLATLFYALWLQNTWSQLWRWLQDPNNQPSPTADGLIDDVCRHIDQIKDKNRSRKNKLAGYLKQFRAASSALPDCIIVLGESGEVEWANQAAKKLLGVRWPKDANVRINNLVRDPEFQTLIASNGDSDSDTVITSPLNPNLSLEMKLVNYMGNGRLLIARDVSQTIKLQRMRRDFVANVSHELRTPLTVLRGYLETFTQDTPSDMWQLALPTMQQQTERMRVIIKDLLVLSQLETGEKPLNNTLVDISSLLTVIIEDAKRLEQFNEHQIELHLETDKNLLADADEIQSAISNLVFNAVKYTPPKCKIEVVWKVSKNGGELIVADHGDGISQHHLERLTERFYRVDKGRSQAAGGTGLGLAIVKHVLHRHDAELKISSREGEGSRFICEFPKELLIP